MTVCVSCLDDRTWLRVEHRANVRREDRGQPPQLTEIRRVKQKMADCAARGHHDAQAGPAARHGARTP